MLLKSADGSEFELSIEGYEFPEIVDHEWDSNWLRVRIRLKNRESEAQTTDPCLLTCGAAELLEWIKYLTGLEGSVGYVPDFMEPNLRFLILRNTPESVRLEVSFIFEKKSTPTTRMSVILEVAKRDLLLAAQSLQIEIDRFPTKAREP